MPRSYKRKIARASTPLKDMDKAVNVVEMGKSGGEGDEDMQDDSKTICK